MTSTPVRRRMESGTDGCVGGAWTIVCYAWDSGGEAHILGENILMGAIVIGPFEEQSVCM